MADDLYETLGVSRSASDEDIRKAYRKKVKQYHPDINPGDAAAEEKFKAVSAAWDILGDPDKRARYDRGEIDASGEETAAHRGRQYYREYADAGQGARYTSSAGFEDFADMSDIFADLFGRGRGAGPGGMGAGARTVKMRGADRRYHLEVDFLDAVTGATRRLTLPGGETLDVTIPAGIEDGATMRLRGKGDPGIGGGPAGDALVEIAVRPHAVFWREGDDILMELPISIDEAVLGGRVEVPTVTGRVAMNVPKGSDTGDTLRLRGKGIARRGGKTGDQRVRLKVVMPDRIDPELEEFMARWRESHGYDPRADLRRRT